MEVNSSNLYPMVEFGISSFQDTGNRSIIGLKGKFLRFRRDGVSISYTVICLSHSDVCLAIT
jgi:hypothetical protein